MTRSQQRVGKSGENLAAVTLISAGVLMVEKISTPVLVSRATGQPVIVAWGETVSGDHRGILEGGRSVLAETKTIIDRPLRWSDLRDHQPGRLDLHTQHGGLSLLVWVHATGVFVMEWPIPGFEPGTSITLLTAQSMDQYTRALLASAGPDYAEKGNHENTD